MAVRGAYAPGIETKRAILTAASELFRERGLAAVSKPEIAAAAGVFPSQLGYHFGTKEALFVEAACRDVLHLASDVERAAARCRTPRTYVRALVQTALAAPALLFFAEAVLLVRAHPQLAPRVTDAFERLHREGERAVVENLVARGWELRASAEAEARGFWAAVLGAALEQAAFGATFAPATRRSHRPAGAQPLHHRKGLRMTIAASTAPLRGTQVYPDYELAAGDPSPSRYRDVDTFGPLDYYALDPNLRAVLDLHAGDAVMAWADARLHELGASCGDALVRRAEIYDRVGHELERHDRFGRDVSRVLHHPDWITSRDAVFDFGLVGWNHDADLVRRHGRAPVPLLTAFDYLVGQADMALCCPLELSHGTVAVLERFGTPQQRDELLPRLAATDAATRLQVAQVATEITGGSDVGASRTEARFEDGRWLLTGEKWFASNCGADLIVTLGRVDADTPGTKGLAMFAVPRTRADGTPNGISIRRLKDKLGTIGVPTGELILTDAEAELIGEADRGWSYMAEMLNHTRFWNAVGSLGVMRRAFLEAAAYAARRRSFGAPLDAFPMVRERLVWLAVDLAATTALTFECAAALERAQTDGDESAALRFRTLAPLIKYRAGEQNVDFARAAVETLGGNGYIETFPTARLLRDAQVNTIWEGTSNICALDLQRAIAKQQGHRAVLDDLDARLAGLAGAVEHLVAPARELLAQTATALDALASQPQARRDQQARRVADLVGDAVAFAAMTIEADFEAGRGDFRKALMADLFAARRAAPTDQAALVTDAFTGVPDLYLALFADGALGELVRAR